MRVASKFEYLSARNGSQPFAQLSRQLSSVHQVSHKTTIQCNGDDGKAHIDLGKLQFVLCKCFVDGTRVASLVEHMSNQPFKDVAVECHARFVDQKKRLANPDAGAGEGSSTEQVVAKALEKRRKRQRVNQNSSAGPLTAGPSTIGAQSGWAGGDIECYSVCSDFSSAPAPTTLASSEIVSLVALWRGGSVYAHERVRVGMGFGRGCFSSAVVRGVCTFASKAHLFFL